MIWLQIVVPGTYLRILKETIHQYLEVIQNWLLKRSEWLEGSVLGSLWYHLLLKFLIRFGPIVPFILMFDFYTPWKRQKSLRFSDAFRGYKKGALGTHELTINPMILSNPNKLIGKKSQSIFLKIPKKYQKKFMWIHLCCRTNKFWIF